MPTSRKPIASLGLSVTICLIATSTIAHAARPQLTFQNRLGEDVTVYWVPEKGERREQGKIAPGGELLQQTTIGHRFLVEGEKSDFRREVVSNRIHQTAILSKERPPNILFLMGDDWSWPHAGFLGDESVRTPTFDRLAREGVVFDNAFVSSPSCTPSRFSVLTGQWHWLLGSGANLGGSLPIGIPTYTELLADAGYETAFARKGAAPSSHEFRGQDPFGTKFRSLEEFLAARDDEAPFCFWYGAGEPHRPYQAGVGKKKGLDPDSVVLPKCLPDNPIVRSDFCDYLAAIERFDSDTARMLKALQMAGELANTITVLSGDNGMPFPRCKATLYDTGTRVPLVVSWPNGFRGGRRNSAMVSLTDLAPTFLQAAGLPVSAAMTGESLLPILTTKALEQAEPEKQAEEERRPFILTGMEKHVYENPARAIRTHDFLYIRNFEPQKWRNGEPNKPEPAIDFTANPWPQHAGAFSFNIDPSPTKQLLLSRREDLAIQPLFQLACEARPDEQLYDLKADPHQIRNVVDDPKYAEQRNRLAKLLAAELHRSGDPRAPLLGPPPTARFEVGSPPKRLNANAFYTKYIDADGYPILASKNVSDYALKEAAYWTRKMLANRPDVKRAMITSGSMMLIIAHNEYTTTLPEFAHFKPKNYWDARARGTGGSETDPYCTTGEENLLGYEGDPYSTECILIHEFAHNIHLRGMVNIDRTFDTRLQATYDRAMAAGLWQGKYASVNHHEYFAEGVQSWFNNNRENDHDHNHVNTRKELLDYDPGLARICREVFGDTVLASKVEQVRVVEIKISDIGETT